MRVKPQTPHILEIDNLFDDFDQLEIDFNQLKQDHFELKAEFVVTCRQLRKRFWLVTSFLFCLSCASLVLNLP